MNRQPELMDDPALPETDHLEALEALRQINALSFTAASLATAVAGISRSHAPLTIVDVACGGGDVTLDLARRLARHMPPACGLNMIGVDISPRAVERARSIADARGVKAEFFVHDVVTNGCPPCDVAVSSLFLHHLDDDDARGLLARMAAAARDGVVVSDLVRSRLGLALATLGTTLLVRSKVARVDGPMSVRAARTLDEYHQLLATAGLNGATIRRVWPERVILSWSRPEPTGDVAP